MTGKSSTPDGRRTFARSRTWLIALPLLVAEAALAAPPRMTVSGRADVSVVLEAESGSCPDTIPLRIESGQESDLAEGSRLLSRAMAWAQLTSDSICPAANAIQVQGIVGGRIVYQGVALRSNGWALTQSAPAPATAATEVSTPNLVTPVPQQVASARTSDDVRQCDALGAHPDDPEAHAKGVNDASLDARRTIAACEAAIRQDSAPRLSFQLARAYLKADRFDEAISQLLIAAEQQHGAAMAYLADMVLDGAPGIDADPVLARQLYEKAIASGFTPAKKILDEFEDMTEVVAKDEAEEAQGALAATGGERASFVEPNIMNNILSRQFDQISVDEIWTKKYLVNIADNIRAVCETHFSQGDVDRLKQEAETDHYRISTNQSLDGLMAGGLAIFADFFRNPGAYAAQQSSGSEDGFDEAMKDTGALFKLHLCNTPGLSSFSKNLAAFVTNQEAPLPPPDAITRACLSNPVPSRYSAQQFCTCFGSLLQTSRVSQKHRKNLVSDFRNTATEIMTIDRNRGPFQVCQQGPR